jgi:hypothetical protein
MLQNYLFTSLIPFLLSLFVLFGFRWNKNESSFYNALIFLFVAVGIYASVQTLGRTIMLLPVVFFVILAVVKWEPHLDFISWLRIVPFALVIWLFFYFLLYGYDGVLRIPHEDYISYSRYAFYNERYALENIGSYYNELTNEYPVVEFYHFFELWASSMFSFINGDARFINQYLLTFPLLTVLVFSGIHNLLKIKGYPFSVSKWEYIIAFVGLIVFFTNRNLYSSFMQMIGKQTAFQLPINQINYFKLLPVALLLLFYLNTLLLNQWKPFEQIGICFLYLPVLPLFAFAFGFSEWWGSRFQIKRILPLVLAVFVAFVYVMLFYLSSGHKGLNSHLGLHWVYSLRLMDFVNSAGKIVLIYFIGYGISLGLFSVVFYRCNVKKPILFMGVVLLSGIVFLAAQKYVFDMNQMLFNLAEPLVALVSALCFIALLLHPVGKRYAFIVFIILCLPGFVLPKNEYFYELPRRQTNVDTTLIRLIKQKGIQTLLLHSNRDKIEGTLQANERLTNQFSYLNCFIEDLNIVNTTLSLPLKEGLNQFQIVEISRMREKSPIYQFTKPISENKFEWTLPLMERYKIQWLLTSKSFETPYMQLIYSGNDVFLYHLQAKPIH